MSIINAILLCDGTSDICLTDISQLMIDTHFPERTFRINVAHEFIPARFPLAERIARTNKLYKPDILICHRDAEAMPPAQRLAEIEEAIMLSGINVPVVCAVPVRMIESWLLCDESAIRSAANNRNGINQLFLPPKNRIERLPDPKEQLLSILRIASDLPARRMQKFDVFGARRRITNHLTEIKHLRALPSFISFEQDFVNKVNNLSEI